MSHRGRGRAHEDLTDDVWRNATILLAFCVMRTIYLRNVPDEVAENLERLAGREGISLNAFSVRELAIVARRADNAALLAALPSLDVDPSEVIEAIDGSRSRR